jgi:hypothetical protein
VPPVSSPADVPTLIPRKFTLQIIIALAKYVAANLIAINVPALL